MIDVKVNLTIALQGSTMISKEESLRYSKQLGQYVPDYEKHDHFTIEVNSSKSKGTEILKVMTRKTKPARQVIQLSEDTYKYMIGSTSPYGAEGWSNKSAKQRLYWHANQIAEALGGTLESLTIID